MRIAQDGRDVVADSANEARRVGGDAGRGGRMRRSPGLSLPTAPVALSILGAPSVAVVDGQHKYFTSVCPDLAILHLQFITWEKGGT